MVRSEGIQGFGKLVKFVIFIITAIVILGANPIKEFNSDATLKTFSKIAFIGAGTTYLGMLAISYLLWMMRGYLKIGILETKEGSVQMGADSFVFSMVLVVIGFLFKLIINIR
ncbi:MAG: hypothetical protein A2V69_03155 [Candidatus Portnoybacteria bacterium RBG_13_40_8]|uniref:Uncharacterized protein n=1 Tax=Candidatus Portnoybacteria bacterium RBG_13_40_8 TaxID=1801990 RepID=A0A1G2F594_9BACT|nr:MAG: hypothetical protein A2V69_03155 [Candidatus Portnoybacteria bacterium RBG_13_40_8]